MSYKIRWKEMSLSEKAEYIWEYYRLPIILTAAVIVFFSSVIIKCVTEEKAVLNILMINTNLEEAPEAVAYDEFLNKNQDVLSGNMINCNVTLNFEEGTDDNNHEIINMENYQLLSTWILSGDYDVFIGTGAPFMNLAEQGALLNLSEVLPQEFLREYQSQLIYAPGNETTEAYPCAVELEKNEWLCENGNYEKCYLGILKNGENKDAAAAFVKYLLDK